VQICRHKRKEVHDRGFTWLEKDIWKIRIDGPLNLLEQLRDAPFSLGFGSDGSYFSGPTLQYRTDKGDPGAVRFVPDRHGSFVITWGIRR
jgi:hypothetical protein